MCKYLYIISLLLLLSFFHVAKAQYKPDSYSISKNNLRIVQVDKLEKGTIISFEYTSKKDPEALGVTDLLFIPEETHISIEGDKTKYKLISSLNMPIMTEAENKLIVFDNPNEIHRFVLEFEKLPEDCMVFNLIEEEGNPHAYNFYNINLNPLDTSEYIDILSYIENYEYKEAGVYYVKGKKIYYVKSNGIIVNAVTSYLEDYGKYFSVDLKVQNFKDHAILFNPSNISVIGYKHPEKKQKKSFFSKDFEDPLYHEDKARNLIRLKNDSTKYDLSTYIPVELTLLTYSEYDKIVQKKQNTESFWRSFAIGLGAVSAGFSTTTINFDYSGYGTYNSLYSYGSIYANGYGHADVYTYDGLSSYLAGQMAGQKIRNMQYEHKKIRHQISEDYVRKHTIPDETEYSGYFNIKHKKDLHKIGVTIIIDGEKFSFIF